MRRAGGMRGGLQSRTSHGLKLMIGSSVATDGGESGCGMKGCRKNGCCVASMIVRYNGCGGSRVSREP